jgi:integrase
MAWTLKTVEHPTLYDRYITLIIENGVVHLPSARFLLKETKTGGRYGLPGGRTSHLQKAKQLRELLIHLENIGKTWDSALEVHVEAIRNSMLHWDRNGNPLCKKESSKLPFKKIKNNTMNTKLSLWFKFYKYMEELKEPHNLVLSINKKIIYMSIQSDILGYSKMRYEPKKIEVWKLLVPSSPKMKFYKAITRKEFKNLCTHLTQQDIVFDLIVRLMGDTGLRVEAATEITPAVFKSYFRYFKSGKSMESRVPLIYRGKGKNEPLECNITIRIISEIQKEYLSSLHIKRLKKYKDYCEQKGILFDKNIMWILSDGRPVKYVDIYKAIRTASVQMGRTIKPISAHWLRHSFAVWKILDYKKRNLGFKINIMNINPDIMILLQNELGHADAKTTMIYSWTAFQIEELERLELEREPSYNYDGPLMTFQLFRNDKYAQNIVKEIAIQEFGIEFDENRFDPLSYAISRRMAIDSNL